MTSSEMWDTLMRFHTEVTVPSVLEPLRAELNGEIGSLRSDMNAHLDAIYRKLDRIARERDRSPRE